MTEFQKIAIGLLGLTHPEIFSAKPRATAPRAPEPPRKGRGIRTLQALRFVLAALAVGSRTVALADNSKLSGDLGARAAAIYGPDTP